MGAALLGSILLSSFGVSPAAASSHCASQSSAARIRDCETLLGLKDLLRGANGGALNWAGSLAIQSWDGVDVEAGKGVVTLNLEDSGLKGKLPTALGSLQDLATMNLSSNELTGGIPEELGDLSNLRSLSLERNKLSGGIPMELGDATQLRRLLLSFNRLSGSIPTQLGSLTNLQTLDLGKNQLTGSIPSQLSSLTNLSSLSLADNRLDGEIPSGLGSLNNLVYLYLQRNKLTGGIPTQLGSLTSLQELSLHRNPELGGEIPTQLGSLSQLRSLWLDKAGLTGAIPSQLGSLARLQVLGLSCNELSGAVPGALGNTGSGVTGNDADGTPLGTHIYLQGNDLVDAEDRPLRRVAQLPASLRSAADGGTKRTTPELALTLTGLCRGDSPEPPPRKPKPKPALAPRTLGKTDTARAVLSTDGATLRLVRRDLSGQVLNLPIGNISADRGTVTLVGVIRDADYGQTYIVVRRDPPRTDGAVVRRWVPPDSPLVGQIAWPEIIANYTVPTDVLAAIPLDGLPTVPGQALRSTDRDNPGVYRWDGETHQWRRVPDEATFQALGLYSCDVTVAHPGFFTWLPTALLGPPYPAATEPLRTDYPTCRAA